MGFLDRWTWAQCFALIAGLALTAGGIVGLTENDTFNSGSGINGDEFLNMFEVNGWTNLVHLVAGGLGLLVAAFPKPAKLFAEVVGVLYLAIGIWGVVDGGEVAGLMAVNAADNVLHLGIGFFGLKAGLVSGPGKHYKLVSR
jgi:hypothetical protein